MTMADSEIQPYQGNEPYIFISYAHRNREDVLAVAARMQAEGCRVWYDEGISPGTERAEHIAERLTGCDYFIAFLSPEYLESANCLDELNVARDKEKNRLLIYLSNITLPGGISMRVNRLQAIHKYACGQEEFYKRLFLAKGLSCCMVSAASGPEGVSPHVPDSPPEPEKKIQELQGRQDTAKGTSAAAHSGAVFGKRRKLLLLVPTAVCILLALLILSLAGNNRADEEAPPDANPAYSTASALMLDSADLNRLSFGMSPDEVREIMTAAGAAETTTFYNPYGILTVAYDSVTAEFFGCEIVSLTALFNSDGLQQLLYYVPQNNEIPQTLRVKYGEPDSVYTDCDKWDLGDDFILMYYYYNGIDGITIGFSYGSYLDMRNFSWGMSPAEAKEAEASRFDSLTLIESDIDSEGYPFETYEGEWEILGNPVSQLSLIYRADQLVEMKYILTGASLDSVAADLTVLYGEGTDQNRMDGTMSWRIMMMQPDGGEIPIAFSASRVKKGVLMTWQDWERCQAYCRPPGFSVMPQGKYPAGGLQSGCTANSTDAQYNTAAEL